MTKESGLDDYELSVYFKRIEENPKAALIKLADGFTTAAPCILFSNERMKKYLRETKKFMIPMASYCKKYYPEYNNAFCILKNNIEMLNSTMMVMLEKLEEGAKGKRERRMNMEERYYERMAAAYLRGVAAAKDIRVPEKTAALFAGKWEEMTGEDVKKSSSCGAESGNSPSLF